MDKLGLLREGVPLHQHRLRQFFVGTQIAAACGMLNLLFFGSNLTSDEHFLFFRLDFIVLGVGLAITSFLNYKVSEGQYLETLIAAYLWLWAVVMAIATWFEGGLYSPLILSFPIILIFSALFVELCAFVSLCGFLTMAIVFMGLNHLNHWCLPPPGMEIHGVQRVIGILVLTCFSGYVCWVFGEILKSAFESLRLKNQRAIQAQEVIKKLSNSDGLTGLLNRNGAQASYQKLLEKVDFSQEHIVIYLIDLDNFKNINDLFDHHVGDKLLVTLANRLQRLLRPEDFACRFGGDEFVLFLHVDYPFDVEAFADKIIASLAERHTILGTESEVSASIGIATAIDMQSSFGNLCKKAGIAMYKVKQAGKNSYHRYSDELEHEYMRNLNILNALENAIANNLLDLYYQPKVNLVNNQIVGVEALLRWNRGNDEGVGPEEFIPIIESTELIHSIGTWVINEACLACKKWHDAGESLNISVNVSALQLTRSSFYQTVADTLQRVGLPPNKLEVEITEHSLIKETSLVNSQLEDLKALGVALAIDDFGTGYSNMGYLTRMQIDVLKLDRSFVSRISESEQHLVIVMAVIKMARVLGMKVVAEGIETEREREILVDLECDFGQGYWWSRPVPESDLMGVVHRYPGELM